MVNNMHAKNRGFIALALTLSVAGILLALVAASSLESVLFFDQVVRKEYRAMNYHYAENCLHEGMLMLSRDYFLALASTLEIPEYHCAIVEIKGGGDIRTITAKGNFHKADVYRRATVRLRNHGLDIVQIE